MNRQDLGELTADAMMMARLLTNLVRGGGTDGVKALEQKMHLADAVCLHAELKEHLAVYDRIIEICRAVEYGRYLDYQRGCNRWHEDGCRHACTSAERCDGFLEMDPYDAILMHLDELQPLSDMAVWAARTKLQKDWALNRTLHECFPGITPYTIDTDDDGNEVMVPLDESRQAEFDVKKEVDQAVLEARVAQYDAHRALIRQVCQDKGSIREILALVEDGLPLQSTVKAGTADRPPAPPSPAPGLVYVWSELLGEYLLVQVQQA
jgi:hypothetical protein